MLYSCSQQSPQTREIFFIYMAQEFLRKTLSNLVSTAERTGVLNGLDFQGWKPVTVEQIRILEQARTLASDPSPLFCEVVPSHHPKTGQDIYVLSAPIAVHKHILSPLEEKVKRRSRIESRRKIK